LVDLFQDGSRLDGDLSDLDVLFVCGNDLWDLQRERVRLLDDLLLVALKSVAGWALIYDVVSPVENAARLAGGRWFI
jgi:hypothetical protein